MRKILNLDKRESLIAMLICLDILENDLYNEDHVDEDVLVTGVVPIEILDIDVLGRFII